MDRACAWNLGTCRRACLQLVLSRGKGKGTSGSPEKTRLVYCRDSNRRQDHPHIQFDFLSYSFRPREAKSRRGKLFTSFLPAISDKAKKAIVAEVRIGTSTG